MTHLSIPRNHHQIPVGLPTRAQVTERRRLNQPLPTQKPSLAKVGLVALGLFAIIGSAIIGGLSLIERGNNSPLNFKNLNGDSARRLLEDYTQPPSDIAPGVHDRYRND